MPSFGASQSISGSSGMNSGRDCKMSMKINGVSKIEKRGIGARTNAGMVVNGDPTFNSQKDKFRQFWIISGITRDSAGAILGSCTVHLFDTNNDIELSETISDATTGAYSFSVEGNSQKKYAVAYKAGSPDVAGTTRNDLYPTLT